MSPGAADRHAASRALHDRVRAFIAASEAGEPPESFDALACALSRFQTAHIPALARLARARGVDPSALVTADDIPAVPTDVFKLTRLSAHGPEDDTIVFRTSGTTIGQRGEHPARDTATYARGAVAHGRQMLCPDGVPLRVLVVGPPPDDAPDSSLTFMCALFGERFSSGARYFLRGDAIDDGALAREIAASPLPVLLLGTSFAFVHLLDQLEGRTLPLPPCSRVMQTGGFKGRSRIVEADVLLAQIADTFVVSPDLVVSEYGMTELSSQCYEGAIRATLAGGPKLARGVHVAPPWLRVTAVDGETLAPLPPGEVGLARMVDLANVDSAVAVQTQDRVRLVEGGFELLGRAPGAPPRGCSLATEEMLGAVGVDDRASS